MTNPSITILMSAKNASKTVESAIESILQQSYPEFEFLIINDGSTDATPDILEAFKKKDSRIRIIHQENLGLTKSLQKGLNAAAGELIFRQDADDLSVPNRISMTLPYLKHNAIVVSGWENFDESRIWTSRASWALTHFPQHLRDMVLSFVNIAAHGTYAFKKTEALRVGGYREYFTLAQDYDLLLRLKKMGMQVIPQSLYQLRIHKNSLSIEKKDKQKTFAAVASMLAWSDESSSNYSLNQEEFKEVETLRQKLSGDFPIRSLILNAILAFRYSS